MSSDSSPLARRILARSSLADAGLEPIEGVPEQPSVSLAETGGYLRQLASELDQWLLSIVFFATMGTLLALLGCGASRIRSSWTISTRRRRRTTTLLASVGTLLGRRRSVGWPTDGASACSRR